MEGPGPSTGYSPQMVESKEDSPYTISSDSGPVESLPKKLQKVSSDASGRAKTVMSFPEDGRRRVSRSASPAGDGKEKTDSSIREDEGSGGLNAITREGGSVDPQTAPIPISDGDDNNVVTVADSTISSCDERRARTILLKNGLKDSGRKKNSLKLSLRK